MSYGCYGITFTETELNVGLFLAIRMANVFLFFIYCQILHQKLVGEVDCVLVCLLILVSNFDISLSLVSEKYMTQCRLYQNVSPVSDLFT